MTEAQTLKHIITSRKSVYSPEYSDTPIPEEVLQEIISSADEAPNHKRTKPWRLKVYKGDEKVRLGEELVRLYKENVPAESFSEIKMNEIAKKVAKSYAVVTISVHFSGKVAEWEEIAATAMAVQNMYLTCTAHAVGCYWGTPGFMFQLKDFLQLEENERCYGLFFMGKKR
jgi:nitroreductase